MATFDVQEFIDRRGLSWFQVQVFALCGLIVFIDGFDTQAIGYVAPAIVKSWHVDRAALTSVFSAGLFGLMLGALSFGPIADRFGRKPVLVLCALFFGLMSLLTPTADSVRSLAALRFLTGLGLGGAMPNAIALTTEYASKRIRATAVMIMFCGFSLGAAFGAPAAARPNPRLGGAAGGEPDLPLRVEVGVRPRRRGAVPALSAAGGRGAGVDPLPGGAGRKRRKGRSHPAKDRPRSRHSRRRHLHRGGAQGEGLLGPAALRARAGAVHAAHLGGLLHEPARSLLHHQLAPHHHPRLGQPAGPGGADHGRVPVGRHDRDLAAG